MGRDSSVKQCLSVTVQREENHSCQSVCVCVCVRVCVCESVCVSVCVSECV